MHVFLEIAAAAGDGFADDEADEELEAFDLGEGLAARMRLSAGDRLVRSLSGGRVAEREPMADIVANAG
jgi:hypothetical protein